MYKGGRVGCTPTPQEPSKIKAFRRREKSNTIQDFSRSLKRDISASLMGGKSPI